MSDRDIHEQLSKYLTDLHSIEEQALIQLRRAPAIAGDDSLAEAFEQHLTETEGQEHRLRGALDARGADSSALKDAAGKVGGLGMLAFAESQPDTPGKLTAHAYSYEHMEIAAYELLERVAKRAGDDEVAELARQNHGEEVAMASRLGSLFDTAVDASLREVPSDDLDDHLDHYIADAHALERQAATVLSASPKILANADLKALFEDHLGPTREHEQRMRDRLEARGTSPSRLKDAALAIGGLNIGAFFAAQPDTPIKLVGFAFAFEHIEAAAYELLHRVADRAGDTETAAGARQNLDEERSQAEKVREHFDLAVDEALAAQGVRA